MRKADKYSQILINTQKNNQKIQNIDENTYCTLSVQAMPDLRQDKFPSEYYAFEEMKQNV